MRTVSSGEVWNETAKAERSPIVTKRSSEKTLEKEIGEVLKSFSMDEEELVARSQLLTIDSYEGTSLSLLYIICMYILQRQTHKRRL